MSNPEFSEVVRALEQGDFSGLDPVFAEPSPIIGWYGEGLFGSEPRALNEALACACFNGRLAVAEFLLDHGVDPAAGNGTGMNAFHWAANRGQLATVRLLIERGAPLEIENIYGGTVLGCTVWSAVHEPRGDQIAVIEALLDAGANMQAAGYPTGNPEIDRLLESRGL